MWHGHFQCWCALGCCAPSRPLLELGSWNGFCKSHWKQQEASKTSWWKKKTFSAEVRCQKSRLQLGCHLRCLSLWGKWEETIILIFLIEWWLIRAVHHRETNPRVNRCLFCILQPVMEKKMREHNTLFQFDMQCLGTTTDKSQFVSSCLKTTTQLGIILSPSGSLFCEKSYWWLISAFLRAVLMVRYLPWVLISNLMISGT